MILEYLKRNEKNMIFSTILTMILGIVLIINPEGSMQFITIMLSCIFLLFGFYQIIDYFKKSDDERLNSISLILGVVLLSIGVFLFIRSESLFSFITTIIGFTVTLKSLFKLQYAFNVRKFTKSWLKHLLVSLVGLVIGVILVINPFASAANFLRIIGIFLVIDGILEIIQSLSIIKELNSYKDDNIKEIKQTSE